MGANCNNCGGSNPYGARFCTGCGATIATKSHSKSTKKGGIMLFLISVLLIVAGAGYFSLYFIGQETMATITSVQQDRRTENARPDDYRVGYEFFVDGKRYTGEARMRYKDIPPVRVGQETTRAQISIKYLPFYPTLSASTAQGRSPITGVLFLGAGVFIFLTSIKRKR